MGEFPNSRAYRSAHESKDPAQLDRLARHKNPLVRNAVAARTCPYPKTLVHLARDPRPAVQATVYLNATASDETHGEIESAAEKDVSDESWMLRAAVAGKCKKPDTLRILSRSHEWSTVGPMLNNPACPEDVWAHYGKVFAKDRVFQELKKIRNSNRQS